MSYEILFTDDEERRRLYGPLPSEIVDQIEHGLNELKNDPWKLSRVPECPPFRPVGRVFDVSCKHRNRVYVAYFFFHIDDDKQRVIVRRCMMLPRYVPPANSRSAV